MLRTVVVRNELLKETIKKAVRINTTRALSVECTRRRHRTNQPSFLKSTNKLQWKNNAIRFYADYPSHIKINLPALSPTMDTGNIISWAKKEGDKLNEGDLLAEIETDKATMGFETPEEGYLAKILVPAGTKGVPIGKLVCIIVANQGDVAAFKNFVDDSAPIPVAAAPTPAAAAPAPAAAPPPPDTPAPAAHGGRVYASPMARRLAEQRQIRLQALGLDYPAPAAAYGAPAAAYGAPAAAYGAPAAAHGAPAAAPGARVYASPLARRLAEQRQITLQGSGTGMYDSITSRDLPAAGAAMPAAAPRAGSPPPPPPPGAAFFDIPLTSMRTTIAKRLVLSKQTIPHYYLTMEVNLEKVMKLRAKLNKANEKKGIKLSLNDFIIKALAVASMKVPAANCMWMDTVVRQYRNVDVSVAVATDEGLITPIVFNAQAKGLVTINKEVKQLALKARSGRLKPHEFQGGTITLSNLGMFDMTIFSAVINPPQACILAVGTGVKKLVLDEKSEKGFKEVTVMNATLSCDHRVIDGAVGAQWLQVFKKNLEDPDFMHL